MKGSFILGTLIMAVIVGFMFHNSVQYIPTWGYKIKGILIFAWIIIIGGLAFQTLIEALKKK